MFDNCKNSKKQGDVGLGAAIAYFSSKGVTVLLPLTDSQDYDLAIDNNESIKRISVKTTSFKYNNKTWSFNIGVKGGNQSNSSIKAFDKTKVDFVFILCIDGTKYLIPSSEITAKSTMSLGSPWDKFKI